MSRNKVSITRRGFLVSVGAGGLATAAAVVAAVTPESEADTGKTSAPAKRGYQVSEHVNKYYRTTRV